MRVLIVRQGSEYLAQGIDYDLTSQAPTEKQAILSFIRVFKARMKRDLELGREPLYGIPPAPQHFVDAWEEIQEEPLAVEPASDPHNDAPPTFVIHAISPPSRDLTPNR